MADNVTANAGSGGAVFATDDVAGVHYPINKITIGALDAAGTLLSGGNGATDGGTLRVTVSSDSTGVLSVDDNGGTLSVDDGGSSLTVDGTVAATQSGTWNITNISGTVSLPTGAATAANQTTIIGHVDGIEGLLTTIDADTGSLAGCVGGTELQVDVVTSALPTGAATSANQSTEITALQLIDNPIVAHDAAVSGSTGVNIAGYEARSTEPTAVADADASRAITTLLGKQVTLPFAIPGSTWNYAAASGGITNTTGVTAKAAAGAGVRNYVTAAQIVNGHATVSTDVQIRDGASGTVLWRGFAQAAGGGVSAEFDPPLRGSTNTLVEVACGTTGSATYFNLQGFVAAE